MTIVINLIYYKNIIFGFRTLERAHFCWSKYSKQYTLHTYKIFSVTSTFKAEFGNTLLLKKTNKKTHTNSSIIFSFRFNSNSSYIKLLVRYNTKSITKNLNRMHILSSFYFKNLVFVRWWCNQSVSRLDDFFLFEIYT